MSSKSLKDVRKDSTISLHIDEAMSMWMSIFRSRLISSRSVGQSPRGLRSWTHHQTNVARHHASAEPLPKRLRAPIQISDGRYLNKLKASLQAVYKCPDQYEENGVTRAKYELIDCPLPDWRSVLLLNHSMKQIQDLFELPKYTPAETAVLEEEFFAQYISLAKPSTLRKASRKEHMYHPYVHR